VRRVRLVTPQSVSAELAAILESNRMACRVWPEQMEGPYYRTDPPTRRDIVEDRDGVPLAVGLRLADASGLLLVDAMVEVWHCDALGRYSGFPPPSPTGTAAVDSEARAEHVPDRMFLRGRQHTDSKGMVEFRTIYPGWYPGRTVHIHLMVRAGDEVFTSQLYFPDAVSDDVLARAPYRQRPGRDTTNQTDTILPTGGEPALLDVVAAGDGYLAAVCLAVHTELARTGEGS
jgi:protocatechuate 3,4-dioxygenase beta subunit